MPEGSVGGGKIMGFSLREGNVADLPFLWEMLYYAAFWQIDDDRGETPHFGLPDDPQISVILEEWGRPGDVVYVGETNGGRPIGAAWYRFYTREAHSYGFVDDDTPEIAVAVKPGYRGQGVSRAILRKLLDRALTDSIRALSLSVDRNNYAAKIYRKLGFEPVGDPEASHLTMVLTLFRPQE